MPAPEAVAINLELKTQLLESGVGEFKWKKVKGARDRFAARKLIDTCVIHAKAGRLRVDILIWDTQDSRCRLPGRDDAANLRNMYVQLFKNVMRKRWPMSSTWQIYMDQNSTLDLDHTRAILSNTDRFNQKKLNLLGNDWISERQHFRIMDIAEAPSEEIPLIQAVDLFVGMGVFSYQHHGTFVKWDAQNSSQLPLIPQEEHTFTSKESEHCATLRYFINQSNEFGISNTAGLSTFNPDSRVNFWFYRSQRIDDKAPRRKHGTL